MSTAIHACRTARCWREHATDGDGISRCLNTPHHWLNNAAMGNLYCSMSTGHRFLEEATSCRFDLRLRPKVDLIAPVCSSVLGALAGAGIVTLVRALTIA